MDKLSSLPTAEEIRATRRNSSTVTGVLTAQSSAGNLSPHRVSHSSDEHHIGSSSPVTHSKGAALRRSSSIADEDVLKVKQLYSKLSIVLSERAKLNPGLRDPRRTSFHGEDSSEISNILKAESQFVPNISMNGEFTLVDAVNEEVDCALMDAIDNYGHNTFLPEDEEILLLYLREVSNKLHGTNGKTFSRRRGTKMTSLIQLDAALLEAYTSMKSYFSSVHALNLHKTSSGKILKHPPSPNTESSSIQKWSFDPFVHSDAELIDHAFQMIRDFDLIEKFQINPDKLRNLLSIVRKNYRPNAFHNFYHGFGVMHLSYQILQRGAAEFLTPLDILATLVGALMHDLDHPGNNK